METSLFVRIESEERSFSKAIKTKGNATRVIGKNLSNKAFAPFLTHITSYSHYSCRTWKLLSFAITLTIVGLHTSKNMLNLLNNSFMILKLHNK